MIRDGPNRRVRYKAARVEAGTMRLVPLLLACALAGCLGPPGATPPVRTTDEEAGLVRPHAFDGTDAAWVAFASTGCGMCSGQGVFRPHAEHHNLWMLDDGTVLLVDFNGGLGEANASTTVRLAPGIAFDADDLARLFAQDMRGAGAEVWVVRVHTARLVDDALVERLGEAWRPYQRCAPVTDYGASYGFVVDDRPESRIVSCMVDGEEPFSRFLREMSLLQEAMRASAYEQGIPES